MTAQQRAEAIVADWCKTPAETWGPLELLIATAIQEAEQAAASTMRERCAAICKAILDEIPYEWDEAKEAAIECIQAIRALPLDEPVKPREQAP